MEKEEQAEKETIVGEILSSFGIPDLRLPGVAEIFGWYHSGSQGPMYLKHSDHTPGWSVEMGLDDPRPDGELRKSDYRKVRKRAEALAYLCPPALPSNPAEQHAEPGFIYKGWLWAWIYSPVIARWTLAPLAKL